MTVINMLFIILLIISITEIYLLGSWNNSFFTFGITLFMKRIDYSTFTNIEPKIEKFINNIENEDGLGNMKGKVFTKETFFFREKLLDLSFFRLNYTPVMHGIIQIDSVNRSISIKGLLNSYFVVFCIFWFVFISGISFQDFNEQKDVFERIFTIAPVFVCLLCYIIQFSKYRKIVKKITKLINEI